MSTKQPEALRLAEECETGYPLEEDARNAGEELLRLHAENEALRHKLKTLEDLGKAGDDVQMLRMGYAAARLEIESLKAQLEAVGAGGVGPLLKHCIHQISEPAQDALKHVYSIAVSAVKTKSRDIADWREDMDRIATIASRAPNPERSDSAPSPIGAPDTVSETAPERIWLQIDPHGADIERAEPFPADDDGVTWCRDSVGGVEVAYVRADLGEGRCASVSEREFKQFLSDVHTAAGLVAHGKRCKDLGRRLGEMCMRLLTAPKVAAAAPAQAAPVDAAINCPHAIERDSVTPVAWPTNAAEVREFFYSHCQRTEYANAPDTDDWAEYNACEPSDNDRYQLTAHDFLSAIEWWAGRTNEGEKP